MSEQAERREPLTVERDGWDDIYGAALDVVDTWLPDGAGPADAIPRWLLVTAINAAVDCAGVKPANHAHHRTKRTLYRSKRRQARQGQRIAEAKAERDEALAVLDQVRSIAREASPWRNGTTDRRRRPGEVDGFRRIVDLLETDGRSLTQRH